MNIPLREFSLFRHPRNARSGTGANVLRSPGFRVSLRLRAFFARCAPSSHVIRPPASDFDHVIELGLERRQALRHRAQFDDEVLPLGCAADRHQPGPSPANLRAARTRGSGRCALDTAELIFGVPELGVKIESFSIGSSNTEPHWPSPPACRAARLAETSARLNRRRGTSRRSTSPTHRQPGNPIGPFAIASFTPASTAGIH